MKKYKISRSIIACWEIDIYQDINIEYAISDVCKKPLRVVLYLCREQILPMIILKYLIALRDGTMTATHDALTQIHTNTNIDNTNYY